ncbi:hypothetical protein L7F22_067812 [Adiantum nelumboides]|nr:hypothetical protein [Adiantum nelumboides]
MSTSLLVTYSCLQLWSYGATSCADGAIEEFQAAVQTSEGLKEANMITWGNSNGVVGVCEVVQPRVAKYGNELLKPVRIFPPSRVSMLVDDACPPDLVPSSMSRVARSKVTAIRKLANIKEGDKDSLIFTTLGSGFEGGALHLLNPSQVFGRSWSFDQPLPLESTKCVVLDCSVWTAAYTAPDRAIIGTSKGVALAHLETSVLRWLINSKSDALAQESDMLGNLVFCGFRNGYITMVDMRSLSSMPKRMPLMQTRPEYCASRPFSKVKTEPSKVTIQEYGHARQKRILFRDKEAEVAKNFCETMRMNSAICSLRLLHSDESYLLASAMNGDLYLWDRRLAGRGPVVSYSGNKNTCLPLCLGVDSSESLVASGGEDNAVRIWSLRSGKLLRTVPKLPAIVHNFSTPGSNSSPALNSDHAWRMWLGSSAGVMCMHG